MIRKLLTLFILLSFITHSIGGIDNENPILRRITYADFFGALAILIGFASIIKAIKFISRYNNIYITALILLATVFLPIPFSLNLRATLMESLIILFLLLISALIFQTFKNRLFSSLIPLLMNLLLLALGVGFYDLVADMVSLPRMFKSRTNAEVISGFRNAGQAGAYFMVFLSILIPLQYSELKQFLSKKDKKKLSITVILSVLFLFSTGKIAGYIGFVVGVFLFALLNRNFKTLFTISIASVLLFFAYSNLDTIAPDLSKRLERRIRTRIVEKVNSEQSNNSFFSDNWGGAIEVFKTRPFTGTGLGGYAGNYGKHEVHSTYLKMIGETGILGVFGYLFFIITFINLFRKPPKTIKGNPYYDYLIKMMPFVIGCLVSWMYTYHVRKREFWILIAVALIVNYNAKLFDYKYKSKQLKS